MWLAASAAANPLLIFSHCAYSMSLVSTRLLGRSEPEARNSLGCAPCAAGVMQCKDPCRVCISHNLVSIIGFYHGSVWVVRPIVSHRFDHLRLISRCASVL